MPNLETFVQRAVEQGALAAKVIESGSIVTAPWVRLKCQFGCGRYGKSHCCPPKTPTPSAMQSVIDCYTEVCSFTAGGRPIQQKSWSNWRKKFFYPVFTRRWGSVQALAGSVRSVAKTDASTLNWLAPRWRPAASMFMQPLTITVIPLKF